MIDGERRGLGECAPLPDLSCDARPDYSEVLRRFCDQVEATGQIDYEANDGHDWTVARELLVGHLCIVLLCLYELMVEVKVVRRSCHELPCAQELITKLN